MSAARTYELPYKVTLTLEYLGEGMILRTWSGPPVKGRKARKRLADAYRAARREFMGEVLAETGQELVEVAEHDAEGNITFSETIERPSAAVH